MAASGIQEHNEARRKQMHMERLAFLHKMLNDKYKSTYESELNSRNGMNCDPQSCRMIDQDYPYFCRVEPKDRTGREIAHAPPVGQAPQSYKYVYDATPNDMAVSCYHGADYFPQDRFRISYDNPPNIWKVKPNAYTVPVGYRPDERALINYDFKPRPARTYTYMTQMRADANGTNQYTPYAEMFSAKLPKRFTTTDYLMQW